MIGVSTTNQPIDYQIQGHDYNGKPRAIEFSKSLPLSGSLILGEMKTYSSYRSAESLQDGFSSGMTDLINAAQIKGNNWEGTPRIKITMMLITDEAAWKKATSSNSKQTNSKQKKRFEIKESK